MTLSEANRATLERVLLPCPFCGDPGNLWRSSDDRWGADCDNCGCELSSPDKSREGAITAWNRRAEGPQARKVEGERLREIADLARELVSPRGMVNRGVGRGLVVIEEADRSDPHYRLCTALDRLAALSPPQGEKGDQGFSSVGLRAEARSPSPSRRQGPASTSSSPVQEERG
jgi:hypothetical protein